MKRTWSVLFAGVAAIAMTQPAHSFVATATLDWSRLDIDVSGVQGGPAPNLTLTNQTNLISATASTSYEDNESSTHRFAGWSGSRTEAAHTAHANSVSLFSESLVSLDTSMDLGFGAQVGGSVSRSASFSVDGPGMIMFTIPYSYTYDIGSLNVNGYGNLSLGGSANIATGNNGNRSGSASFNFYEGTGSGSGLLSFAIVADAGGSGLLDFGLSSSGYEYFYGGPYAPEPSTMLALAAGLAVLGAMGRRRIRGRGM